MKKKIYVIKEDWALLINEISVSLAQQFLSNESILGNFTLKQVISGREFASLSINLFNLSAQNTYKVWIINDKNMIYLKLGVINSSLSGKGNFKFTARHNFLDYNRIIITKERLDNNYFTGKDVLWADLPFSHIPRYLFSQNKTI